MTQESMDTKGVASVRSPVCNLQQFLRTIDHASFVDAVISAFRKEYNVHEQVHIVEEDQITTNIDYIRNGMAELPNWEWAFGQTPEFTHTIQHSFKWGDVMAKIHSKHGVILGCSLTASASVGAPRSSRLQELAARLENQKYGFVDESGLGVESWDEANYLHDVWQWMKAEMDS
ncbi:hypothetical protein AcW1_004737 [Taiwanofungus camphoratus]|nr:hypothetical protein AcV5_001119 [Antrodia cinnamomea]KAI0960131.1 hypothetical protein AcW1_004737 [Antrodia cinnamomea]